MKRRFVAITLFLTAFFAMLQIEARAAELGGELQLAPQSEGPSLIDTLRWIKKNMDSLQGFIHHNTAGWINEIKQTSFTVDGDYVMNIKQRMVSRDGRNVQIEHFVCDLKELKDGSVSYVTPTELTIWFNKNCTIYSGRPGDSGTSGYPRNPPFRNEIIEIDTGDPEKAEKLAKAFKHVADILAKMPKKRSDDLF